MSGSLLYLIFFSCGLVERFLNGGPLCLTVYLSPHTCDHTPVHAWHHTLSSHLWHVTIHLTLHTWYITYTMATYSSHIPQPHHQHPSSFILLTPPSSPTPLTHPSPPTPLTHPSVQTHVIHTSPHPSPYPSITTSQTHPFITHHSSHPPIITHYVHPSPSPATLLTLGHASRHTHAHRGVPWVGWGRQAMVEGSACRISAHFNMQTSRCACLPRPCVYAACPT